mgnify:CR=1 FL=1
MSISKIKLIQELREEGAYGSDFRDVDLSYANLRATDLQHGDFQGANFQHADLRGASLRGANLCGSKFLKADLRQTMFKNAQMDHTTQIDPKWFAVWQLINEGPVDEMLPSNDFSDAYLTSIDLAKVDCWGVNFDCANLRHANFTNADLRGASLLYIHGAETLGLHGALRDEDTKFDPISELIWQLVNGHADVHDLSSIHLAEANLHHANFSHMHLCGANLKHTDLRSADFCSANLEQSDLLGADLRGANLQYANLNGVVLRGANLCGADFRDATLSHIDWFCTQYDHTTQWPTGFSPQKAGAILVERDSSLLEFAH